MQTKFVLFGSLAAAATTATAAAVTSAGTPTSAAAVSETSFPFNSFLAGEPILLNGEGCRALILDQLGSKWETITSSSVPHRSKVHFPSLLPSSFGVRKPFRGMEYMGLEEVKIETMGIDYCSLVRDEGGVEFNMVGLSTEMSASLGYRFDSNIHMPFAKDSTRLIGVAKGTISARINWPRDDDDFGSGSGLSENDETGGHDDQQEGETQEDRIGHNNDNDEDQTNSVGEHVETENNNDDDAENDEGSSNGESESSAHGGVGISVELEELSLTSSGSQYSDIYNLLIKHHGEEIEEVLKTLVMSKLEHKLDQFCQRSHLCSLAFGFEWGQLIDRYLLGGDDDDDSASE